MTQPTNYTPTTDFSQQESINASGRSTVNTAALDAEFANIETTLDQTVSNLSLIQRDDGRLADLSVDVYTLTRQVLNLIGGYSLKGAWQPSTSYAEKDIVDNAGVLYFCVKSHTSPEAFVEDGNWSRFGFSGGEDAAASAAMAAISAAAADSSEAGAVSAAADAAASALSAWSARSAAVSAQGAAASASGSASVSASNAANSAAAAALSAASVARPIPIAEGGTGATSAALAISALGGVSSSTLSASSGAAQVGAVQAGTGAVSRTVQDKIREMPHPSDYATFAQFNTATGPGKGLWTDWSIVPGETEAGRIRYVKDRLFVGDAAKDDGIHWVLPIPATVQPDGTLDGGVSGVSYLTNRFKGSFQYLERYNQFGSFASRGGIAGSFATQASDNPFNGAPIGVSSIAFNNHSTNTQGTWSYYGVAIRDVNSTVGVGAITAELHVSNMVNDSPQWDGYSATPVGLTSVLHLCQGGEHTQASAGNMTDYNVTSAINLTRFKGTNGGAFLKGIIFHKDSLAGCDGSTGIGIALDMAKGHQLQWRSAAGDAGVSGVIRCDAASHNASPRVILGTNAFSIKQMKLDETETPAFQVILPTLGVGEGVNGVLISCQKTGAGYAAVQAFGVDTDVDLYLAPKGAGLIRTSYAVTAGSVPGNFSAVKRLAVKDSTGTTYYIPCSATLW